MFIPNLSVVCFFICLSYFIFDCALLLFCAQAWHGKTLSSRINPIFFCSLHWRNLSLYNKITTTHFKQIRFWWKNVIKFRGKVYSNFFKFVQQLFFLSVLGFSENHTLGNNRSQLVIYCGLKPNLQSIFYGNLPFVFTGWYIELCTLYTTMSVIKNVFKHISPLSDLIISVCPFQLCCFRVKSMCVNLKAMTPWPKLYESVIKTLNLLPSHWSHASK